MRQFPPPAPDELADGRSCDCGNCHAPSIGWRWFRPDNPSRVGEWLPACKSHLRIKGLPPEFKKYDPPLEKATDG